MTSFVHPTRAFWPMWLASDIPNIRILTFGYPAHDIYLSHPGQDASTHTYGRIFTFAESLLSALKDSRRLVSAQLLTTLPMAKLTLTVDCSDHIYCPWHRRYRGQKGYSFSSFSRSVLIEGRLLFTRCSGEPSTVILLRMCAMSYFSTRPIVGTTCRLGPGFLVVSRTKEQKQSSGCGHRNLRTLLARFPRSETR